MRWWDLWAEPTFIDAFSVSELRFPNRARLYPRRWEGAPVASCAVSAAAAAALTACAGPLGSKLQQRCSHVSALRVSCFRLRLSSPCAKTFPVQCVQFGVLFNSAAAGKSISRLRQHAVFSFMCWAWRNADLLNSQLAVRNFPAHLTSNACDKAGNKHHAWGTCLCLLQSVQL